EEKIPKHIVFIPDGNRTWARVNNIPYKEAYEKGISKIGDILEWCMEKGIKNATFWGFSTENFKREGEVSLLFDLFRKKLKEGLKKPDEEKPEEKVKIRFLGRIHLFPKEVQDAIKQVESKASEGDYHLNILLGYGGRAEILDAVNKLISSGEKEITEEKFSECLYTKGISDPDLIIRTSGNKRLSGLFPWQSVYSELYFTDVLWPDFSKGEFEKALSFYASTQRKFGK
ncbi:di-trans,poly-cis-decaprenylcistransferase, partial [Candidatus Micrarchaeota archaeon]|nr:di-trans,poly-cis-decaprenylcistransferase [Candidatus Micrarchaeota archaeon]